MNFTLKYYRPGLVITVILILSLLIDRTVDAFFVPFGDKPIRIPTNGFIIAAIFSVYNQWLWKLPILKYLLKVPDIGGRYEGKITYDNVVAKGEKLCVIEIYQTASRIAVSFFTEDEDGQNKTSSKSTLEHLHEENGDFTLKLLYSNSGNDSKVLDPHEGVNILHIQIQKKAIKLSGHYFTNRRVQTRGNVEARLKSKFRKNSI